MDTDSDFVFGNIVRSPRIRGWLYDLGRGGGVALTVCNAVVAHLLAQNAIDGYPLWLGAISAGYIAGAPYVFGVSKANVTYPTK